MPTYSLTWLPDVLRAAGLKVVERPGWKSRGRGEMGKVVGVLCHHTAGARAGNAPTLELVVKGRPDLAGPLAQLVLGRDGTFFVVAAGRCNHAGAGDWPGVGKNGGNAHLIGIEAENTGKADDNPWPPMQLEAYARGAAAICSHLGLPASAVIGHLEYAPGRKSDPSFSIGNRDARLKAMQAFRKQVAAHMHPAVRAGLLEVADVDDGIDSGLGDAVDGDQADDLIVEAMPVDNVRAVQERLRALGYFGVGKADGDLAGMTRGAIVTFKHEHGLAPETPDIDRAFLAALSIAQPRVVSDARANATAADIAPTVPTVKETWWSRLWAKILAIPAMGVAVLGWLQDNFKAVQQQLEPVTAILGTVPTWAWCALAGGAALLIWRSQRHAEQSTIDLFRQGRILS